MQLELDRRTAAAQCADRIRGAILNGEIAAGTRLPPERALAERFGVHRVTIRSALKLLEAERLVSVRQGSGYTVRDVLSVSGLEVAGRLVEAGRANLESVVEDLLLVRRQLARALFERLGEELARGSPTDGDAHDRLAAAFDAVDRFAVLAEAEAPIAEIVEADLDVVAALVDASGSTVLRLCFNPVAELLRSLPALQRAMFRAPTRNAETWRLVLGWIADGRADLAAAVVDEVRHIDRATVAALRAGDPTHHRKDRR